MSNAAGWMRSYFLNRGDKPLPAADIIAAAELAGHTPEALRHACWLLDIVLRVDSGGPALWDLADDSPMRVGR